MKIETFSLQQTSQNVLQNDFIEPWTLKLDDEMLGFLDRSKFNKTMKKRNDATIV